MKKRFTADGKKTLAINKDLEERVMQFRSGKLWGQPKPMHMGTYHLVNDLWAECDKMIARIEELMDAQPVSVRGKKHKSAQIDITKSDRFVQHIQRHLAPGEKVVCKICHKTIDYTE